MFGLFSLLLPQGEIKLKDITLLGGGAGGGFPSREFVEGEDN